MYRKFTRLAAQPGPFFSCCQHTEDSVTFETAPFALILQNKHYRSRWHTLTQLCHSWGNVTVLMWCVNTATPRSLLVFSFQRMNVLSGGRLERERGRERLSSVPSWLLGRVWNLCSASWAIQIGLTRLRESWAF